tara:strand:+ start:277 stop:1002 length:726 start_codon:yes stop_codon:yes gene_type:complete
VLNKLLNNHKTKKNTYLLLLLLFLIIIVEYILSSTLNKHSQLDDKIANHYLTDFTMTETDSRGEISWILSGKRLEKFPNSERSEVINPSMKILSKNDGYWIVTSEKALDPDSLFKSIYLYGDVKFIKRDDLGAVVMDIATESAVIYPNEEKVETDKFGIIKTPDSKTSGVGIIADMDNGYVKILSKAKRLSFDENKVGEIQGDKLIYNMESRSWKVLKKTLNDTSQIKERVTTILKTRDKK